MPFSVINSWRSASVCSQSSSFSSHLAQVLNQSAALLSNYEVLQLLRELEADHIARTRTAQRLKKEEEDVAAATGHLPPPSADPPLTVSENLRTIEVEVRCALVTPMTSRFLTYFTPGHPVSHCRLSTHTPADCAGHPTSHEKPRSLWPHKGRKAPNCQPNPRRARRALCCVFLTPSPL